MDISAILLAGGRGKRFASTLPKQFTSLDSQPLIHYSLQALQSVDSIQEIIVVCDPAYRHFISSFPHITFANPGKERQESVYKGFINSTCPYLLIHDAARPFPPMEKLPEALKTLKNHKGCAFGMPLKFSLKKVNEEGLVIQSVNRNEYWEVQTPQIVERQALKRAFENAFQNQRQFTDDLAMLEAINEPIKMIKGSYRNLKVTTPEDLQLAQALL